MTTETKTLKGNSVTIEKLAQYVSLIKNLQPENLLGKRLTDFIIKLKDAELLEIYDSKSGELLAFTEFLVREEYIYVEQLVAKDYEDIEIAKKIIDEIVKRYPKHYLYGITHKDNTEGRDFFKALGAKEGKVFILAENPDCSMEDGWIGLNILPIH